MSSVNCLWKVSLRRRGNGGGVGVGFSWNWMSWAENSVIYNRIKFASKKDSSLMMSLVASWWSFFYLVAAWILYVGVDGKADEKETTVGATKSPDFKLHWKPLDLQVTANQSKYKLEGNKLERLYSSVFEMLNRLSCFEWTNYVGDYNSLRMGDWWVWCFVVTILFSLMGKC